MLVLLEYFLQQDGERGIESKQTEVELDPDKCSHHDFRSSLLSNMILNMTQHLQITFL